MLGQNIKKSSGVIYFAKTLTSIPQVVDEVDPYFIWITLLTKKGLARYRYQCQP